MVWYVDPQGVARRTLVPGPVPRRKVWQPRSATAVAAPAPMTAGDFIALSVFVLLLIGMIALGFSGSKREGETIRMEGTWPARRAVYYYDPLARQRKKAGASAERMQKQWKAIEGRWIDRNSGRMYHFDRRGSVVVGIETQRCHLLALRSGWYLKIGNIPYKLRVNGASMSLERLDLRKRDSKPENRVIYGRVTQSQRALRLVRTH